MRIIVDDDNYIDYIDTPWNTRVLGYASNEITDISFTNIDNLNLLFNKFEKECELEHVGYTSVRVLPHNKDVRRQLMTSEYHYVETSLFINKTFNSIDEVVSSPLERRINLRNVEDADLDDLQKLSYEIFNHGRFLEDVSISEEVSRKRSQFWIKDLMSNSKVVILETKAGVKGFMAYKELDDSIEMILGGVDSQFSHLVPAFWSAFFKYCICEHNTKRFATTVSAANVGVLNLYNTYGFNVTSSKNSYSKLR